jgi:sugar lactone lactonase YvrE
MGNLYVANVNLNNGNSTIEKYTSGGGSLFANPGVAPAGLAFDSAGNLYVANDDTINTIGKYTPDGGGSVFANAGLNVPEGLAFDSAGNLYVANLFGNSIVKYTPGGVGSIFASTGLSDPTGLAFDSAGNLYVANVGNSTIEKFTPGGVGSVFASNEFGSIGVGSGTPIIMDLSNPEGVAFDSAGNLYAANAGNGTIEEFTPDDVGSLFASGLNNPSFIAIVPAPEPSTLALLTLGLPSLLAIRRKLKK